MGQTTLETLNTDTPAVPKTPKPVQLRTAHDYQLTTTALTERVDNLKKLAKKNEEEGYKREAKNISADAAAIEHYILPQFRDQRELSLNTRQELQAVIVEALRPLIRPKIVVRTTDRDAPVSLDSREKELATLIANRVREFAEALYEEAYNAGYAAREQTFEAFAMLASKALYGSDGV